MVSHGYCIDVNKIAFCKLEELYVVIKHKMEFESKLYGMVGVYSQDCAINASILKRKILSYIRRPVIAENKKCSYLT